MRQALGLAAAAVVLGAGAGGGHTTRTVGGPAAEVRSYIAAMNRHDPAAVCATFAPALKAYERRWDNPTLHPISCATAVAGHFSRYYSDQRWRSARIVAVRGVSVDARGIAGVTLTLDHHYVCVPPRSNPDGSCRMRTLRLPDRIYLARDAGAWRVVKPGFVLRAAELPSGDAAPEPYTYPPGDARTVTGSVRGVAASGGCPATRATFRGNDRLDASPAPHAPWLQIQKLSVSQLRDGGACYALTLAAPPRPDSAYQIAYGPIAQADPIDVYEVDFDGLGYPHVLFGGRGAFGDPPLARSLPRVALHGQELDVLVPGSAHLTGHYLAGVGSQSLQAYEPMIRHPLFVSDDGVPYGACLVVPTGQLIRAGNCGTVPSG